MIVVDTSAVIAIAQNEPEMMAFARRIGTAGASILPSPAYVEASLVLEGRFGAGGRAVLDSLIQRFARAGMTISPFDAGIAELARTGFRTFGKGRHPAGLNFGDCLVYATAKALDAPLLFKGEDFALTDIARA